VQRTPLALRRGNGGCYRLERKALPRRNIWRLTLLAERKSATIDPIIACHLRELEISLDPSRPEPILPDEHAARVGIVDVGCGMGQLFGAKRRKSLPALDVMDSTSIRRPSNSGSNTGRRSEICRCPRLETSTSKCVQ
jgi:2-polyprenyl-3-methyl-5-hydroxy-6-metoxy-1,4-benzoquinol methylase